MQERGSPDMVTRPLIPGPPPMLPDCGSLPAAAGVSASPTWRGDAILAENCSPLQRRLLLRRFHMDKLAAAHYPAVSSAELIAASQAWSTTGASYKNIPSHCPFMHPPRPGCKARLHLLETTLYSFIEYSNLEYFVFISAPKATQYSSNFLFTHP